MKLTSRGTTVAAAAISFFIVSNAWGALGEDAFLPCSEISGSSGFCNITDPHPTIGGKSYTIVAGLMQGTTSPGGIAYKAPITIMYPSDCSQKSGVAVADMVNNTGTVLLALEGLVSYGGNPFAIGYLPPTPMGRILLGDEFIGGKGHVLASLQYQGTPQSNIPVFSISKLAGYYPQDANAGVTVADDQSIMQDSSVFLRNLGAHIEGACSSDDVVSFGYSRSAGNMSSMLSAAPSNQHFEGNLLGGSGVNATGINANPSLDRKTIVVNTESDLMLKNYVAGQIARTNASSYPDNYRLYEIAGAPHNPTELIDLNTVPGGAPNNRQSPAQISPVFRAMLEHLVAWIQGTGVPPTNALLDISGCEDQTVSPPFLPAHLGFSNTILGEVGDADTCRGADGTIPGGVRLPFVTSQLGEKTVGSPLGTYIGAETAISWTPPYVVRSAAYALSGVFERDNALISEIYKNHGKYVSRVALAADNALSKGWINEEDKDAYTSAAALCPVGILDPEDISDADILECHGY